MIGKISQNRFQQQVGEVASAQAQAPVAPSVDQTPSYSMEELQSFLGERGAVFAKPIGIKDFKKIFDDACAKVYNAESFGVAFQEHILRDRTMLQLFLDFNQKIQSGVVDAAQGKRESARVAFNRVQFEAFYKSVGDVLKSMESERQAAPTDITSVALRLIERNRQVQAQVSNPLEAADTLTSLAKDASLPKDARISFADELCHAGLQHDNVNRTPEQQKNALATLVDGLNLLYALEAPSKMKSAHLREAQRMAKEQDGEHGFARQVEVVATMLHTNDAKTMKAAREKLFEIRDALLDKRLTTQEAKQPLDDATLEGFQSLAKVMAADKDLFAAAPELIDAVTCHPKLNAGEEDSAPQDVAVYTPSDAEAKTQVAMVNGYVQAIAEVFPSLDDVETKAAHQTACEYGQTLALRCLPQGDQSKNFALLIREFCRHPELASTAAEFVDEKLIPNVSARLDAARDLVVEALKNRNIDAAWDNFQNPIFKEHQDPRSNARQAEIYATAAEVLVESKGDLQGSRPALRMVGSAHQHGIAAALDAQQPAMEQAKRLTALLASDWDDIKLPAQDSLDFVNNALAKSATLRPANDSKGDFGLHPDLIRVMAKHPESQACMDKAEQLIGEVVAAAQRGVKAATFKPSGATVNIKYDHPAVMLETLQVCSEHRELCGHVDVLADLYLDSAKDIKGYVPSFLSTVVQLGEFANKEALARKTGSSGNSAYRALILSGGLETNQRARELVAAFAEANADTELQNFTPELRKSFLQAEAAARRAIPNLMSEEAVEGLFKGFQLQHKSVSKEVIKLVPAFMPEEIVAKVLDRIDSDEIRKVLAESDKPAEAADEAPETAKK